MTWVNKIKCIHFPLPGGMYFELAGLYPIRSLMDGITFFDTRCGIDVYDHHCPRFVTQLIVCNINVFELNIYRRGDYNVER